MSENTPVHVFAIAAITKDGFIARSRDQVSTDWTSEEDKKWFWDRTGESKAVVMGSTTFWTTGKPGHPLPARMNYVLTSNPVQIWNRYKSDEERKEIRAKDNLKFLSATPEGVIEQAVADGFIELAVSGGTRVYTDFLSFIKTLYLTRETSVEFGAGLPLFEGMNLDDLNDMLEKNFKLISSKKANDQGTIFEEWKRKE